MKLRLIILPFIVGAHCAAPQVPAKAQSSLDAGDSSATVAGTKSTQPDQSYNRPTEITKNRRDDLGLLDRLDVYYGMADNRIGVARLDLPEVLPLGGDVDAPEAKV
jgi:hypothetical protein